MIPYEKLDSFQKRAVEKLKKDYNVIVAAPTGTGKTAIIDHVVSDWIKDGRRIIYTGPLKALCNQKFRDFSKLLGSENVGLITGDEVINEKAPMLIMTTEVLRNMLQEATLYPAPKLVVFDEIHYISDDQRGAAWEEAIVLLPPETQILGLSATIPNAEELATWIEIIKDRETVVIRHSQRAVPLKLLGITRETGMGPLNKVRRFVERSKARKKLFKPVNHIEIVTELQEKGLLPALYFLFNRKKVEAFARELGSYKSFVTNREKAEIRSFINSYMEGVKEEARPFLEKIKPLLLRGIGYHHAGLIPQVKRVVEMLFEKRLLKVVYCTSTFALGVNMPAKTVCFDSIIKFDGTSFRPLKNIEFFQKAGRAGRRGIDDVGYVIVRFDPKDHEEIPVYNEKYMEPVESAFKLSYNSIVNLLAHNDHERIERFLNSSLWSFQHEDEKEHLKKELLKYRKRLEDLPTFECEYREDFMETKRIELEALIERDKKILASIDETLETEELSRRKKKRLLEKRKAVTEEIIRTEYTLKSLKLESCEFCPHKIECRATDRKRKYFTKKIKKLEEKLRYIDSYLLMEFEGKCNILKELNYIDENLQLKFPAEIVQRIHIEELLVTEMILEGFFDKLSPQIISIILTCVGKEPDKLKSGKSRYLPKEIKKEVEELADFIKGIEEKHISSPTSGQINWAYADAAYLWSTGEDLSSIVKKTGIYEGDIISALRQGVDLGRQLKRVYLELPGFRETPGFSNIKETLELMEKPILREFSL
ncbi:MAG: DEAD/DEAH box helicase [Deferribacteres bacterium]|nr:DEAD/DEAH box helicase [Deferribacteres bacterium]